MFIIFVQRSWEWNYGFVQEKTSSKWWVIESMILKCDLVMVIANLIFVCNF
jgi:hypothetical protein